MDLFALVLAVLFGIAFIIFVIGRYIAGLTQEAYRENDPAYQAELVERISPIGSAALPGDVSAEAVSAAQVTTPAPVAAVLTGPQVYNTACLACHGAGIGGAPILGDADSWSARISQGQELLNDHALNGYQGSAGYMPPKGGRADLSDDEIIAAVGYMIDQSR
jgi:cytochrome c5